VVIVDDLDDGVSIVGKLDGPHSEVHIDVVRVGPNATISDVLAHRRTIARLTRYNGLVGSVRQMWDELLALIGGRVRDVNPFPPGTRVFNSYEEVKKLRGLVEERRALLLVGDKVDARILEEEIEFLSGEVARHQEVVRGAGETLELSPSGVFIERPKTGAQTDFAVRELNYPLPKEHPEHYYYRASKTNEGVYELAIKPTAPKDLDPPLTSWHAELEMREGGLVPTGNLVETSKRTKRPAEVFDKLKADADVIAHVRRMEGFTGFAKSLEDNGLYTAKQIDDEIIKLRAGKDEVTDEYLRSKSKEIFRKKVVEYLKDPELTQIESFRRMDKVLSPMDVADRGNLTEIWYQERFARKSEKHVATEVTRTGKAKNGAEEVYSEDRVIDFFDAKTGKATEVKSGAGPIDHDQFEAYLEMKNQGLKVGKADADKQPVKSVTYVFTDRDGAIENLPWIAKQVRNRKLEDFVVEAFDPAGRKYELTTAKQMDDFVTKFGGGAK
jgi:hypothetical protein